MSVTSKIALRASESERNAWEHAAQASGLKLSAWLRRAANQTAELEGALEKQEGHVPSEPKIERWVENGVLKERVVPRLPPSLEEIKNKMYPQKRKRCIHRLNPNTYCKTCGVTK